MRRKGLMKGKGKGYKNVIGKDPYVHSQSARGIKQPQRLSMSQKIAITKNLNLKDSDGDKVADKFDCRPHNPNMQDDEKLLHIPEKKKGITDFKSGSMHTVTVRSDNEEQVIEATKLLGDYLEDFQNNNKQFNFQGTVIDKDGNKATFLVDFGIEDNEEDYYYVASISGKTKNNKPFDDWTNIEAFLTASEIIENGVESLDYEQGYMEWDTGGTDMFEPNKGMFDATIPIIWRTPE